MESENVVYSLAYNSFAGEDLVVAIVQLFAAHNAASFQVLACKNQVAKASSCDVCASKV